MTGPLHLPVTLAPLPAREWHRNTLRPANFRKVPNASARDARVLQVFATGVTPPGTPPDAAGSTVIQADLDFLFVGSVAVDNRPPARYRVLSQGDWYGADTLETSVRETLTPRLISLLEIPAPASGELRKTSRLVYRATVTSPAFVDLTAVTPRPRWLRSLKSYRDHQLYAARARVAGAAGIHYPSARTAHGNCVICYERGAITPNVRYPLEELSVSLRGDGRRFEVAVAGRTILDGDAAAWLRRNPPIS